MTTLYDMIARRTPAEEKGLPHPEALHSIPSVLSAVEVVELLAAAPEAGLSQADIARRASVSASTCYRILRSLAVRGWVRKEGRGRWKLDGGGLSQVASALRDPAAAVDRARAVMQRVASQRGIGCKFSVRRGMRQVVVARAEPASQVQTTGPEGAEYPLVEGSSGAALLADLDDGAVSSVFASSGPSQTGIRFLRSALSAIRERGWCMRPRILDWPISALSAPVRDASGAVAGALTFVVPAAKAADPALAALLVKSAAECSPGPKPAGPAPGTQTSTPHTPDP